MVGKASRQQLAEDLNKCNVRWAEAGGFRDQAARRLRLEDSTVKFQLVLPGARTVSLAILFMLPDTYPNGPAMACCVEDESVSSALAALNEYYEDSATLPQIMSHIFRDLHAG